MTSLKDRIFTELQKEPRTDSLLAARLGFPIASIRRARNELVTAHKVVAQPEKEGREYVWQVAPQRPDLQSPSFVPKARPALEPHAQPTPAAKYLSNLRSQNKSPV